MNHNVYTNAPRPNFQVHFMYIAAYNSLKNEVVWPSYNTMSSEHPEIQCFACTRGAIHGTYEVKQLILTEDGTSIGLIVQFPYNPNQTEEQCVIAVATLLGLMEAAE